MEYDKDLRSIQEARDLLKKSKAAQAEYASWNQERVDELIKTLKDAAMEHVVTLAKMAQQETGFGKWQDKVLKNVLGSQIVYDRIKDLKTIGILREDRENKIIEVAVPMGVVVALIPSTNPTSTAIYKTLISLKAGNSIIVSPHPNAAGCIIEAVRILQQAAARFGAPADLIQVVTTPTLQATNELMKSRDTGIILATGGEAMVHAAYSSGNPALGVGPGNGPSFIEKTADIRTAVRHILESKTFDNGTICASEQSVIVQSCIKDQVIEEMKRQHFYFMDDVQTEKVGRFIMRANNTMNPKIVGRDALTIAKMADINVPSDTLVLVGSDQRIGKTHPYSREKLCPILGFFVVNSWEEGCEKSIELLKNEGSGHTMTMHTNDENIVREFAVKKPVSRLIVNTPGSLGGVGATTGLMPALTLGCGAVGGSASSDNIGPLNLIDIRRTAYGIMELDELRAMAPIEAAETAQDYDRDNSYRSSGERNYRDISESDIEAITRDVLKSILNMR